MNELIRLAWARFGVIAGVIGDLQGRAIITLFYWTIFVPFALIARRTGDPLRIHGANRQPHWIERAPLTDSLDEARQQG